LITLSLIAYAAIGFTAPMNSAQLQNQMKLVEQQFLVLNKAIESGNKKAICREGFKVLDLYYEIDPRTDLPQEALLAYASTAASMNRLISALKSVPCVPRDPARNKFQY
jgi:hypothetical protein